MTPISTRRRARRTLMAATVWAAAALLPAAARAHHGWSWAEDAQSELSGTVQQVQVAPPHPWLDVKTAQGVVWRVDLGNPTQTERSGFTQNSAQLGDNVTVIGNRDKDQTRQRMKAVQITVQGKPYVMYPERLEKR